MKNTLQWPSSLSSLLVLGLAIASSGCHSHPPASTGAPATAPTTMASMADESLYLKNIRQLTSGFDKAGEAYFSHDGRWVVFQAARKGEANYQLYVASVVALPHHPNAIASLGTAVQVSPDGSRNTCGFFSPDGKSLIFASTAGKEDPNEVSPGYQRAGSKYQWSFPRGMEIYLATDWQAQVLAATSGPIDASTVPSVAVQKVNLATRALTDNKFYDAECAFDPTGRFIVFCSDRTGNRELYCMATDGTRVTQLTHSPTLPNGGVAYNGGPFVSPHGKRLVYRCDRAGNDLLQLYVANIEYGPDGFPMSLSHEKQITTGIDVNWGPWWFPDGETLIYASSHVSHTNYELFTIKADVTHNTRITYSAGADILPVTSPDGHTLMWASKRAINAEGKNVVEIFAADFYPHPKAR